MWVHRAWSACLHLTDFGASELPNTWRNDSEMLKCKIRMIALEESDMQQPKCIVASLLCGRCSIDGYFPVFEFVDQRRGKISVLLQSSPQEIGDDPDREILFDDLSIAVVGFGRGKRHHNFSNGFVRTLLRRLERHDEAGSLPFNPLTD